jgi:hypothetical protein
VYFNTRNTLPKFCPFLLGHAVYVRIILKWTRKWDEDMDWIYLAQDSDTWRVLGKAVMNIRVP